MADHLQGVTSSIDQPDRQTFGNSDFPFDQPNRTPCLAIPPQFHTCPVNLFLLSISHTVPAECVHRGGPRVTPAIIRTPPVAQAGFARWLMEAVSSGTGAACSAFFITLLR